MDLRSSLLGSGKKEIKTIEVEINGKFMKVDVKKASLEDRDKIYSKSYTEENGKLEYKGNLSLVWSIIYQTYHPIPSNDDNSSDEQFKKAGQRVFEDADFEILYKLPTGTPFFEKISTITVAFLKVDEDSLKKN